MNGPELARLLRSLANVVERLDANEIEQLPKKFDLLLSQTNVSRKIRASSKLTENVGQELLKNIILEMRATPSRELGYGILERNDMTKTELTNLARLAQINITKKDDIARIKEKLVESVIGSRLNSVAIRGDE